MMYALFLLTLTALTAWLVYEVFKGKGPKQTKDKDHDTKRVVRDWVKWKTNELRCGRCFKVLEQKPWDEHTGLCLECEHIVTRKLAEGIRGIIERKRHADSMAREYYDYKVRGGRR